MSEVSRHGRKIGEGLLNEAAATARPLGFIPNPELTAELAANPLMVASMKARADAAAEAAKALAPVEHGDYRDSIEGSAGLEDEMAKGRVSASDFKAGWIEFGTIHHQAEAPLRRGAESIGANVKEKHPYR